MSHSNAIESKASKDAAKCEPSTVEDGSSQEHRHEDVNVVRFDEPEDPLNPQHWSNSYRWTLVILLSFMSFIVNIAVPICAPAIPGMLKEFHVTSNLDFYQTMILTVWGFGQMLGPLLLGPFSEIYGRLLIYHVSVLMFILFSVGGALSTSINMIITFRFLMGITGTSASLNPPIVGDLFAKHERGRAMSTVSIAPLFGTVIGPVIGGYLSEAKGWRWTFWIVAILTAAFEVTLAATYRETYCVKILQRKARRLRRETGNSLLRSQYDRGEAKSALFKASIGRPLGMLFLAPAVSLICLYVALVYGYIYLLAATITEVFEVTYGFSPGAAGLSYLGIGLGMLVGVVFCRCTMDRYVRAQSRIHGKSLKPEHRLMPMIFGGILMPCGLFLYGWSTDKALQWIVPIVGMAVFAFGVAVCQVVSSTYLVDAYGIYAASAVAASVFLRFLASAVLPLAAPSMYAKLGLGWGNSILGFLALVFVPAPALMMKYGEGLRKLGKYQSIDT